MSIIVPVFDLTNSNVIQNTNNSVKYCILGKPIPLERPRFGNGHVWDSQKQLKHSWGVQLQEQHQDRPMFSGVPLRLEVDFYMPFPRMTVKKQMSYANKLHIGRPDLDNLVKFVCDASMGILMMDDAIVASVEATKRYSENPRTEFILIEMK